MRTGHLPALRRAVTKVRTEGTGTAGRRALRQAYRHFGVEELEFPLLPGDVADSTRLSFRRPAEAVPRDRPLTVGVLTTPPSLGSGGHTTMFRMIEAIEAAGHRSVVILYDRHRGEVTAHADVIRRGWPQIRADVRDVTDGFADLDVCVATAWPTAHVLATRCTVPMRGMFLVQDFEPFFYPRGSVYALAEDSYRFGFRCVTIGHMAAQLLRAEVGVGATVAEFGCDRSVYHLTGDQPRSGVVFYTKPEVPRRGYRLGMAALELFHERHPDQPIHLFGVAPDRLAFPATVHRRLTPPELNTLYNSCIAGIAMSFTNISLVAEEMLAAGCIAVVNDSPLARADLPHSHARWALATPGAVAAALSDAVRDPDVPAAARAAAGAVRSAQWRPAQEAFLRALEFEAYGV